MEAAGATVLEAGARVGDSYEVVRLIGRGGMGEVWVARHLRLPGKQVAIKVLHTRAGGLSADALARFRREAEVATRIGHPNIVEVHDYNTLPSGAPYLVLEFLQGESLASRLRFGPIPPDEALLLIRQVGSALDASHQAGVVHRDLKPDNVFLVPTPMGTQVKVLDFGISKVVDSSTLQTADEVLVGTPQYMSPEQATGHNKDVGPQTDVFALGSIAYEMLSGAPPFQADTIAKVVFRIAYEPHVPLEQVKAGLQPRVYGAVERALEKDRAKRFASIADFIAELTGSPVPRTVPPVRNERPASGVARPGMATPDSMAMGATAARTPAPAPLPSVPLPSALAAPAPSRVLPVVAVALALVVIGLGGMVFMQSRQTPAPPLPLPAPPPVVAEVPRPPEPALAPGVPEAPEVKPAPVEPKVAVVVAKKLSPEEQEVIDGMLQSLASSKAPLERVRQGLLHLETPAGLSRGYAVSTIAACKEQSLMSARPLFENIKDRVDRANALSECKRYGVELH